MQTNFHFLRRLTPALEQKIRGGVVSECFTQSKDELVIRFETHGGVFFIRATLSPSFGCISFPPDFHRARKNSADLFPLLIGEHVQSIHQFQFERSFSIVFSNGLGLLFKMHGNRSNLILTRDEVPVDLFKKNLAPDWKISPAQLERKVDWSYENFAIHQQRLKELFFTFGKVVWKYLDELDFFNMSVDEKWQQVQQVLTYLDGPATYIAIIDRRLAFTLLPVGTVVREFNDPIVGLNDFYQSFVQHDVFDQERSALIASAKKDLQASQAFFEKSMQRHSLLQAENNYKIWADLLMANLQEVAPGQERIVLPDFYHDGKTIEIKLKKDLSPQKNAAVFYSKAKKQVIEMTRLSQTLTDKQLEIQSYKDRLQKLEAMTDLKSLRTYKETYQPRQNDKGADPLPYHEFNYQGFRILVGKNALSNDKMLQRFSYKDDLWLHAKDVAGSHVLIKYQAGKNFPKEVIERGAQLAGYNSKRKTDTMCPIIVTPRKYVRKRKGDPAGTVVVERETVILVEPRA